jgi:hypothetical protein
MRFLALLTAAFFLTVAPAAMAREFDPAPINALQPGVTTREEAIAALGEPDSRAPSLNNHSTLIYEYDILPEGESTSTHYMFVLLFDPDGKFVRLAVYRQD